MKSENDPYTDKPLILMNEEGIIYHLGNQCAEKTDT